MERTRCLTREEILGYLYGILAMCDGFQSHLVGGNREDKMIRALPKQIAVQIMELMQEIEKSTLLGDVVEL